MKRLKWLIALAARRLGWLGLAGCGLLILSVAIVFVHVLPLQQKIDAHLSAARSVAASGKPVDGTKPAPAWDKNIPLRSELNSQLLEVRSIAQQFGLDIKATDYRLTKVDGTSLWRYQMDFLLDADYVTVQRFIGQLLNALPNLALNGIDITRLPEVEGQVTTNLRFAFYFRQK